MDHGSPWRVEGPVRAIGTIVGAFFGIKARSAGEDKAEAARDSAEDGRMFEASKVQYLAGQLSGNADAALKSARAHALAHAKARIAAQS